MEIAKLILEYLKVLVWPCVTLGTVWIFRHELSQLLARLEHVKLPGGAELDWKKQLQAVETAAEKLEARQWAPALPAPGTQRNQIINAMSAAGLPRSPSDYDLQTYRRLSEFDPNLALAGLRMELDRMLQNLARAHDLVFDAAPTSSGRLASLLKARGILTDDEYELLRSIVSVANSAVHGQNVSPQDALRTIDSAQVFLDLYLQKMGARLRVAPMSAAG